MWALPDKAVCYFPEKKNPAHFSHAGEFYRLNNQFNPKHKHLYGMNLQRKYSIFINIGECNFAILCFLVSLQRITFLITAMVHQDGRLPLRKPEFVC